ncbi:MAG: AEC family transporter [Fusobacteriaceae bacterium]|jgi:predicted permease|nr:AEC family transporter [Fusobacteriaceae bacterium]
MENMLLSLSLVFPMIFMMTVGYILKKAKIVDDHSLGVMNKVQFRAFMSLLIFYNIYELPSGSLSNQSNFFLIGYTLILIVVEMTVSYAVYSRMTNDPKKIPVMIQGTYRTNLVIFGMSIAQFLFGDGNVGPTVILVSTIVPLFNVIAVILLEVYRGGKVNVKKILVEVLKNPLIVGAVLGMICIIFKIKIPKMIMSPVISMSKVATPLAFVILGGSLTLKSIMKNMKYLIAVNFVRLFFIPILAMGIGIKLGFRDQTLIALFGVSATPAAVSSFNMAKDMGADGDLAAEIVVTTSLISILTTFLWIFLLKNYGLI